VLEKGATLISGNWVNGKSNGKMREEEKAKKGQKI